MNILIVNYEFPPIGGGGSKASFELSRRLVAAGHAVTVLTGRSGGMKKTEVLDGVTIRRVFSWRKSIHDCGLRGALTFLVAALPALRRLLASERFDIIHYFFGLPSGVLSLYSHGVRTVPYVISLRGSDVPGYDRDSLTLRVLHRALRPLTRHLWRNAAAVTAVSAGLRRLAAIACPTVEDIRVIHNGVDALATASRRLQRDPDLIRINCVARLIPRKGIDSLIRALAVLGRPDVVLHVIGTGPSLDALRALALELGIARQVVFHGYCDPDTVSQLNENADIFALPTHSEAFANVLLEAMAASLPIVASRVGGIPEAVVDTETGILVEPRDAIMLAAALERLCDDSSLRRRMGDAGYRRVVEQFSWDANARRFEALFREAISAS